MKNLIESKNLREQESIIFKHKEVCKKVNDIVKEKSNKKTTKEEIVKMRISIIKDNFKELLKESETDLCKLANFSVQTDKFELFDKGKNTVWKTIEYCTGEELS